LAWATLQQQLGFAPLDVISMLAGNASALGHYANDVTFMVQEAEAGSQPLSTAIELFDAMIASAGRSVPFEALETLGRWAFVQGVTDRDWLAMMRQLLQTGACPIQLADSVAARCVKATISVDSLVILRLLLDRTDGLQRSWVGDQATRVLSMCPHGLRQQEWQQLRKRLLELGFHGAQLDGGS
jgi:hypothetical protein